MYVVVVEVDRCDSVTDPVQLPAGNAGRSHMSDGEAHRCDARTEPHCPPVPAGDGDHCTPVYGGGFHSPRHGRQTEKESDRIGSDRSASASRCCSGRGSFTGCGGTRTLESVQKIVQYRIDQAKAAKNKPPPPLELLVKNKRKREVWPVAGRTFRLSDRVHARGRRDRSS